MIDTPYVAIDMKKVENNIISMKNKLTKMNIEHWPHIKTHKSVFLAKKQLNLGANGITCATLSEAETMEKFDIKPILIAYPIVGENKLKRLGKLLKKTKIRTIVDSEIVANGLSKLGESINQKIEILIDIDGGVHRGGIQLDYLSNFVLKIKQYTGIQIIGVFSYAKSANGLAIEEIKKEGKKHTKILLKAKDILEQHDINVNVVSGGSTPFSYFTDSLEGITQSRAGNYIFGDVRAVNNGIFNFEECALSIYSTVVSIPLPGRAIIDAGSKTLTNDLSNSKCSFGYIVGLNEVKIFKLDEEHGYLKYNSNKTHLNIGDIVQIIPNHSCVIPNLNDKIHLFNGIKYIGKIKVDARGKNY